ncbi:hypothetical protein M501DRAFT_1011658 [Patellaria atrata CBS 101060]|uniref:Pru domain-containing protein n=1 Tax=Patellaria atrata CBS 101060 TaxID=1346257 RepID=A0A9P4VR21_9PEZI|nr:hypothetical protein M501DRAFT_1011658 [Patellaria atrata CBS 101060]
MAQPEILITFKAGRCNVDETKMQCLPESGYVCLYNEDDLLHFTWRKRSASIREPDLDLVMIPGDASFIPYLIDYNPEDETNLRSPTNGRIFVLKFSSSSQRHLFWLQSQNQSRDPSKFSQRDLRIGQVVDMLLNGEEIEISDELNDIRTQNTQRPGVDGDETMEDPGTQQQNSSRIGTGGAGADGTGTDFREEGEEERRGGEDGGRATETSALEDTDAIIQNFLKSLEAGTSSSTNWGRNVPGPFTTLPDLLSTSTTIPVIESADETFLDALLTRLPPTLLMVEVGLQNEKEFLGGGLVKGILPTLGLEQKREIVKKVLRSPQLHQSMGTFTAALRDGGLPSISKAVGVEVKNGGYSQNGSMPLGGGEAVEAFVEGVKMAVEQESEVDMASTDAGMDF